MEESGTNEIVTQENDKKEFENFLGNTTDFMSELQSGNEEREENPDGKAVEKYFNIKLKSLFYAEKSFSNIKIKISDFLDDLKLYSYGKYYNAGESGRKVSKEIKEQINKYFTDEPDLEIDSFYPGINGENIENFFKTIKNYSYPKITEVNPGINYSVIAESTYCLKSNVIKKSEQMRKIFLLFGILNNYYKLYKGFFENFYEFFIKKYIYSDKSLKYSDKYQKDPNFDLSGFENYVILFVSNRKINFFGEIIEFIRNNSFNEKEELEFNLKKCFEFALIHKGKGPKIDIKKFSGEKDEEKEKINKVAPNINSKDITVKINNSYKQFKYLINNINDQKNFIVKLIYLELYLNAIAPKCEILKKIQQLNQMINETKKELSKTKEELNKFKKNFSLKNSNLQSQIAFLAAELHKINPNFDINKFKSKN